LPPAFPSAEEFARNWPSWRGPTGCGLTASPWPAAFDLAAGTNVCWKVPVGLPGVSSPIVWEQSVYLTGGDESKQTVTAFDTESGAVRWTAEAPWPQGAKPEVYADTGYAAPTPVTDGRQVVALFASGALVAVNCADGKLRWQKQLGVPESMYSMSASLAVWQDRVFVQWDVDTANASALICFQIGNGKELWRTPRKVTASWGSPIVAPIAGKPMVLTSGNPLVQAYDPVTGAEIWRADILGGDVGPSPIAVGDLAVFANVRCELAAFKPGGSGDIGKTHKLWKAEDGLPDMVTPASDGTLIALFSDSGMMTAYRVADGAKAWEQDMGSGFKGSPIVHGNDLLVFSTDGKAFMVKLGDSFEQTAMVETGVEVSASPAVVGGRMYLRTVDELVCIEAKP
jgi:outer membrane protein assembly factor BamB